MAGVKSTGSGFFFSQVSDWPNTTSYIYVDSSFPWLLLPWFLSRFDCKHTKSQSYHNLPTPTGYQTSGWLFNYCFLCPVIWTRQGLTTWHFRVFDGMIVQSQRHQLDLLVIIPLKFMNILNNLTTRTPSVIIDRKDSQTMKMWKSPEGFFLAFLKVNKKNIYIIVISCI